MFNMSDGVDEIELMSRMESEIFNVFVGFCWFWVLNGANFKWWIFQF